MCSFPFLFFEKTEKNVEEHDKHYGLKSYKLKLLELVVAHSLIVCQLIFPIK